MAIVLALVSALAYGISDFGGGLLSRRTSPWMIATAGQASATGCALVIAPFVGGSPTATDIALSAVAGAGSGIGAAFLYRGLATARMGVVAPLSAVGSALIPVTVGLVLGDRPPALALAGIAAAFPAIALISMTRDADAAHRSGVLDGILAGLGFGVMFLLLGQVSADAGMWPVPAMYLFSVIGVVLMAVALHGDWMPRTPEALRGVLLGPVSALAVVAYYYATKHGLLSIVSVIAALYPAATVVLAAALLREKIRPWQGVGLALAAVAVTCVALA